MAPKGTKDDSLICLKEKGSEASGQNSHAQLTGNDSNTALKEPKSSLEANYPETYSTAKDASFPKMAALFHYLKPNKDLIAIKLHFFWGLLSIAPLFLFLTLMIRQRGVSPGGIGVMWSVMPIAGLLAGAFLGTVIDYLKIHRFCFIISVLITPVALSVVYWLPHIEGKSFEVVNGNLSEKMCSARNFSDNEAYLHNATSSGVGILSSEVSSGNLTQSVRIIESNQTLDCEPHGDVKKNSSSGGDLENDELPLDELLQTSGFWIIVICILFSNFGYFLSRNMTDAVCFMMLGDKGHLYGLQRLYTSFAWGLSALVTGVLIDVYSASLSYKDYFPAFIMVFVFTVVDLVIAVSMKINVPEKQEDLTAKDFMGVVVRPDNILFFLTSFVAHVALHILAAFHLLLVEDVAKSWNPDFSALRTLQGLIIVVRCFVGELPVFISSGYAIRKMGVPGCLVLVLLCFSARFILYYFITNPWYFLPVEVLHGFNFGLLKAVTTYNANEIAPKGTSTTMLTVLRITQFAGKSISGVTGGLIWAFAGGHGTFLIMGLIILGYNVLYLICNLLLQRRNTKLLQVTSA
ncbi:major facilitator superfamily domain-containing protein 6-like [Oratosquilla oratoria]|uniref:major facilitator superfamily domain-containing protein 6-like n=1 Tax=Oratosquilla oratoria TaxID=337810 RepID=UPI003F765610